MKKLFLLLLLLPLGLCAQTYTVYTTPQRPFPTYHSRPDCPKIKGEPVKKEITFPDVLKTKDKKIVDHYFACSECAPVDLPSIKKKYIEATKVKSKYKGAYCDESYGITIKPIEEMSSSTLQWNEVKPLFEVVFSKDKELIGCPVTCKVIQVRKSNISGSEGRLIIRPMYITKGNERIEVTDDIFVRGLNISNAKFALFFVPFIWFVPGTGAKIYSADRFTVNLR